MSAEGNSRRPAPLPGGGGNASKPAAEPPAAFATAGGVLPFVSIVIPCQNEGKYIAACLDSILGSTYPKDRLEVFVVDGLSTDGTRDIVQEYMRRSAFIRLLDNPGGRKSRALNMGIAAARGEIIVRLDAHARYAEDYLEKCVVYQIQSGADNVGGIRRTEAGGEGLLAQAIALSVSHPFAAGNAAYRVGSRTQRWVDTVFGGCYRREVFDRIGLFNEALTRAQDREFNQRLRDAGGRILLAPDIECVYYARCNLGGFCSWIFEAGLWPFYASRLSGRWIVSGRNFVPLVFVLSLAGASVASVTTSWGWAALVAILVPYALASAFFSARAAFTDREPRHLFALPIVFALTHVLYGIGTLCGLLKPTRQPVST